MTVFEHNEYDGHEGVHFAHDRESGLHAIIAIHNTALGPALGGCRYWTYQDSEAALTDVLRLSRGMTYKSALAGLSFGGGKSVILANPRAQKTPAQMRAMGTFVESLGGRYCIAEDVGISVEDVEVMAEQTRHVAGVHAGGAGDPSPATAFGVFCGIRAAVRHSSSLDSLRDVPVAVQGLGQVGMELCRLLYGEGARLFVNDLNPERMKKARERFDAIPLEGDALLDADAEVFAPCALGGVINDQSLERLKASIVAGAANNQLAETRHGHALQERGILYAPDYVINAGGVINIAHETRAGGATYDRARAFQAVARIAETLEEIFRSAQKQGIATSEAADQLALARVAQAMHQAA